MQSDEVTRVCFHMPSGIAGLTRSLEQPVRLQARIFEE
jgi:hypothetical protein